MMKEKQSGRRQQKKKSLGSRYRRWLAGLTRGQRIRWRLLQAVVLAAVVILAVWAGLNAWLRPPELPGHSDVSQTDLEDWDVELPEVAKSGRKEGVYTFLVCGKDVVSNATDTMLLISYDTKEKTIHGLNLPRDTMINVSATSKRLNTVYARNCGSDEATKVEKGMAALKAEVAKLTGITPDYYVLVEWEAIGELVDALGGVEFEVPFDMDYDDPYQDLHIHQEAGLRVLTGEDAMQVIRHRKNNDGSHSDGDVGRLAVQQDFLKAVVKKCLQPATFLKIPSLAEIFAENVKTDLTVGNILSFAKLAYGMDPDTGVSFQTAPLADSFLYNKAALVTLDPEGILEIVNSTMNPYLRDVELSDLEVVCRNSNGTFSVTSGTLADPKMGGSSSGSSGSGSGTQSTPVQPSATPEPAQEEPGAAGEDEPAEEENAGQPGAAQGGEEEQPASGEGGQSPGTEQGTQVPQPPAEEPPAEEPVQPAQSGDAEPQAGGEELPPETP